MASLSQNLRTGGRCAPVCRFTALFSPPSLLLVKWKKQPLFADEQKASNLLPKEERLGFFSQMHLELTRTHMSQWEVGAQIKQGKCSGC